VYESRHDTILFHFADGGGSLGLEREEKKWMGGCEEVYEWGRRIENGDREEKDDRGEKEEQESWRTSNKMLYSRKPKRRQKPRPPTHEYKSNNTHTK
jgi:predicted ATP-dependent serine protease